MKLCKFGILAALVVAISPSMAQAGVILSQWTFETNTPADLLNSASGPPVVGEAGVGLGLLSGLHASAGSDWTTPVGNGSANSYSSNEWAVGDYYVFTAATAGYEALTLTFDATSSNTGPRDFKVQGSTDGVSFSDIGFSYSVIPNAAPNSWNATTNLPIHTYTTALPTTLDDQAIAYMRLVVTSTVSSNGGVLALGGTSRIDNVTIMGDLIPEVPEPSSIALMFGCVGIMVFRRK